MTQVSEELLSTIVHRLVDEFGPEEIILFGSHAWGVPTEDSDLDLVVLVDESPLSPLRRAQKAHLALAGLGVPKDVLVRTRAEFDGPRAVPASLEHRIATQGRVLYERSHA